MASQSDPDNCCVSDACRVRGHLSWRTVDLRLRAMREIWVAMTRPDGRLHAVPVWFWWSGASLYVGGSLRRSIPEPGSYGRGPLVKAVFEIEAIQMRLDGSR